MEDNRLVYGSAAFVRGFAANVTSSSFPSKVYTTTRPTGGGVVDLSGGLGLGATVPKWLRVFPIGLGSDNDAYSVRVIGWGQVGQGPGLAVGYVPAILYELAVVLGGSVGVAGSPVLNTERFADTITVVSQPLTTDADATPAVAHRGEFLKFTSPANDLIAFADLDTLGYDLLEFTFDQTTGTPTANVLIGRL